PFLAMDVLRAAVEREHAGGSVIHMEVGQPGAPAPGPVLEAARQALADGRLARHYAEAYGIDLPVERVAVTTGSSAAFNLAFLAAFDPGDRVAVTAPG